MSAAPAMPAPVAATFDALPGEVRENLLAARALIFETAHRTGTGPLTETLKWGEPAYLTEATRAGSTIRLGRSGGQAAVLFNCNTTLVDGFRRDLPDAFEYHGDRALVLAEGFDADALSLCLARALCYHRDKRKRARA